MNYVHLYESMDKFAHDVFTSWRSKCYTLEQFNGAVPNYKGWKKLSDRQKKEIAAFWGIRFKLKSDFLVHEIMMNVKGEFDVRYCPERVFRLKFDDSPLYKVWSDKNYYERYQPGLVFPQPFVRNVNGHFLDRDYHLISKDKAREIMLSNLPLIAKPSLDSGEGRNIRLVRNEADVDAVFRQYHKDFLLQELIVQCDELKKMSPNSVSSMRLITAWVNGEPKLLKSHLLCNTTESIAVNVNAGPGAGVIVVKINEDGKLADTGYYENAKPLQTLPSGFTFGGMEIPSFKEAVRLALEAHQSMPMLDLIGWDVTIDSKGTPVFIEWNQRGIEVYHSQLSQGPLFGEYTEYFAQKVRRKNE